MNNNFSPRNPKKNGFTNGRPSDDEIKRRLDIGIHIIQEHDYMLTKKEFHEKYAKELEEDKNIHSITKNTIYSDRDKIVSILSEDLNTPFEFDKKTRVRNTRKIEENKNIPISHELTKNIRSIRLEVQGRSFVLYDKSINNFCKKRSNFVDENIEKIQNTIKECDSTYLIHLYIIFDVKRYSGVEDYMCSFYKNRTNYILYTSTHNFCSEIVVEYSNLNLLITDTWKIFKRNLG